MQFVDAKSRSKKIFLPAFRSAFPSVCRKLQSPCGPTLPAQFPIPEAQMFQYQCPSCIRYSFISSGDICSSACTPSSPRRCFQSVEPIKSNQHPIPTASRSLKHHSPLCLDTSIFSTLTDPDPDPGPPASSFPSAAAVCITYNCSSLSSALSSFSSLFTSSGFSLSLLFPRISFKIYSSTSSGHLSRGSAWVRGLLT